MDPVEERLYELIQYLLILQLSSLWGSVFIIALGVIACNLRTLREYEGFVSRLVFLIIVYKAILDIVCLQIHYTMACLNDNHMNCTNRLSIRFAVNWLFNFN